jgi:hypothetical protein
MANEPPKQTVKQRVTDHVFKDSFQVNLSSESSLYKSTTKNHLLFNIPYLVKSSENLLYVTVSIKNAQIPVSWYNINENNNILNTSIGNIIFPVGNYNANTFMTMFLLNANWGIAFDKSVGKFTISHFTDNFTILSTSTCQTILGLEKNTQYTSSIKKLECPFPCNFLGINKLNIFSENLLTENLDTNSQKAFLGSIPVTSNIYGLIKYENMNNFSNILKNKRVDTIHLEVTDENDNLINFNNIPLYLTLQFDLYKVHLDNEQNILDAIK